MKGILLSIARQFAYWCLNLVLKQYMKMADTDKNGELSEEEIKKSIKELKTFLNKFRK
jgi:hypothetical protein